MKTVVHRQFLPITPRLATWFCLFTCLDYWEAPTWVFGLFAVLFTFHVVSYIHERITAHHTEPKWAYRVEDLGL